MTYQAFDSTLKLQSGPTGTKVDYKGSHIELNLSVTICASFSSLSQNFSISSVSSRENENTPWKIYYDSKDSNENYMFIWQKNQNYRAKCFTVPFNGDEIKINHFMAYNSKDIFLHDAGSLSGRSTIELSENYLKNSHIIQLDAKQIQLIENINVCNNYNNFDECRTNYINKEMNATFGCVLYPR